MRRNAVNASPRLWPPQPLACISKRPALVSRIVSMYCGVKVCHMASPQAHTPPRRRLTWLRLLPLAGPLLLSGLLAWLLLPTNTPPPPLPKPSAPPPPLAQAAAAAPDWQEVDWNAVTTEGVLVGWIAEQGAFVLRPNPATGEPSLAQEPEPMTEGIYRSWTRLSHGGIRVRVTGEPHRRIPPRFSIGLEGRRPFHLRAAPAHKRLELVTPPEVMLAQAPWTWQEDRALWLELLCLPAPGGGVRLEGRAWPEGDARPGTAALVVEESAPPGRLSPSVRGGPFALKPIFTDRIELLKWD